MYMTGQRKTNQDFKSVAGSALAGTGLFIVFGHLVGIVDQVHALEGNAAGQGLDVFSSVVLSATLDQHWWLQALLGLLWPLLLIIAGAVLLNDDSDNCIDARRALAPGINPRGCASGGCQSKLVSHAYSFGGPC
jgi:hypothetical protein